MPDRNSEGGFTLVELLVAGFIFAIVSTGFYLVLFSATESTESTRSVVDISNEARLGFNRLVRDTREANQIQAATSSTFTIEVDFNGNGTIEPIPSDPTGSYEREIFTWSEANSTITLGNGTSTEVLMRDVHCIKKPDNTCYPVFSYSSSRLEYDTNANGVSSSAELDTAASIGNNNGVIDGDELDFIDLVSIAFRVDKGGRASNFYADAQLRNRR